MDIDTAKLYLLENTNDIVIITEANIEAPDSPKILYVNDAFTQLTGYSKEEAIGRTPRILQGEKTDKKTLKQLKKAMRKEQELRVELLNYAKSGREYWIDFHIIYIRDHTGKVCYLGAIERDITKIKELNRALEKKSKVDPLTKALNRDTVFRYGEEAFLAFKSLGQKFGLIFIDIDNFKEFNDKKGHIAGDKLLILVANVCRKVFRAIDKVGRYGGDEFIVLLEGADRATTEAKAKKLHQCLQNKYQISSSIGATSVSEYDTSLEKVIQRADHAMYEAKKEGKSKVRYCD
ncbi:GGDEF domain-containing protein [Legionella londiniensis]|uniref:GGDEF/EAL domain-containing sensory box protein n=1 Tax=Legionella londiniensis TaxID=45068 RepID=A0A0W0VP34_9GAMM|nr:GGDEF domain-containing protein [Legionella londiniensis]KTD21925.1 GGDEF/EAL domain-containing sensory box protein [Legionella londiniensis]STX92592.1 sensory box protein [Legionella londiniensis]